MPRFYIAKWKETCRIVEEEYGVDWLERQVKNDSAHFVPSRVKVLSRYLESSLGLDYIEMEGFFWFMMQQILLFAHNLKNVRNLTGYKTEVKPRLKDVKRFDKLMSEIYVASHYAASGYKVSFIPRSSDKRTADIKIETNEYGEIHIEVTKKEKYSIDPEGYLSKSDQDYIVDWMKINAELLNDGMKATIVSVGRIIDREILDEVTECIRYSRTAEIPRVFTNKKESVAVEIREMEPFEKDSQKLVMSHRLLPGLVITMATSDGNSKMINHKQMCYQILDSHRLNSISNTIDTKRKRKQTGDGDVSIIYIFVDVDGIIDHQVEMFLRVIGVMTEHKLKSKDHSLINAVVFVGGPAQSGDKIAVRFYVAVNENNPPPSDFVKAIFPAALTGL